MPGKKTFIIYNRFSFVEPTASPVSIPLTIDQQSALFKATLLDTVHRFPPMNNVSVRILAASQGDCAFIQNLLPDTDVRSYQGVTFGDMLSAASEEALQEGAKHVFLLDSTVPTVPIRIIQSALSLLDVFDDAFAIAPTERGGFYAVGMNAYHSNVLRDIDPMTNEGYEQVISRICEFDASVYILNSWYDVRQMEDIVQLRGDVFNSFNDNSGPDHTKRELEHLQLEHFLEQGAKPAVQ